MNSVRLATTVFLVTFLLAGFQNCGSFDTSNNSLEKSGGLSGANIQSGGGAPLFAGKIPAVLAETNPGALPTGFFYAPVIVRDNGRFHMFFCGTGVPNGSWDIIRYRSSTDGRNWTGEKVVMAAANGTASTDRSACDPSVVYYKAPGDAQPYYYLYYTGNAPEAYCTTPGAVGYNAPSKESCGQSVIFVSRSLRIDGPYQKFMGNGVWQDWAAGSNTDAPSTLRAASPKALIVRKNVGLDIASPHAYGSGQPSVVVRNNRLHMWYYDDSGEVGPSGGYTFHAESVDGVSWSVPEKTNSRYFNSTDVKFDSLKNVYVMHAIGKYSAGVWTDGNHADGSQIVRRTSADGVTWSAPQLLYANRPEMNYIHNIGAAGNREGWLDPAISLIAFGASVHENGLKCAKPSCWAQWNIDGLHENLDYAPIFRARAANEADDVLTSNEQEFQALLNLGYANQNAGGFQIHRFQSPGEVPVLRLYNANASVHYYTTNLAEQDSLVRAGWVAERTEGFISRTPAPGLKEIYHLYDAGNGRHVYTTDAAELNALKTRGLAQNNSLGYAPGF